MTPSIQPWTFQDKERFLARNWLSCFRGGAYNRRASYSDSENFLCVASHTDIVMFPREAWAINRYIHESKASSARPWSRIPVKHVLSSLMNDRPLYVQGSRISKSCSSARSPMHGITHLLNKSGVRPTVHTKEPRPAGTRCSGRAIARGSLRPTVLI